MNQGILHKAKTIAGNNEDITSSANFCCLTSILSNDPQIDKGLESIPRYSDHLLVDSQTEVGANKAVNVTPRSTSKMLSYYIFKNHYMGSNPNILPVLK